MGNPQRPADGRATPGADTGTRQTPRAAQGPELIQVPARSVLLTVGVADLVDIARAVNVWVQLAERADRLAPPERLRILRSTLDQAARSVMSSWRDNDTDPDPDPAQWTPGSDAATCTTAVAAVVLGWSLRTVQRRVAELGAVKVGGRWRLDRAAVAAAAEHSHEECT